MTRNVDWARAIELNNQLNEAEPKLARARKKALDNDGEALMEVIRTSGEVASLNAEFVRIFNSD